MAQYSFVVLQRSCKRFEKPNNIVYDYKQTIDYDIFVKGLKKNVILFLYHLYICVFIIYFKMRRVLKTGDKNFIQYKSL